MNKLQYSEEQLRTMRNDWLGQLFAKDPDIIYVGKMSREELTEEQKRIRDAQLTGREVLVEYHKFWRNDITGVAQWRQM